MLNRNFALAGLTLALAGIPAMAAAPAPVAPSWTVDPASSTLGFSGTYNGTPFTGKFSEWDARIHFDPDDLANSLAEVTIDTASGGTGDPSQDEHLPGPDWFSVHDFPQASFKTESISSEAPGSYVAEGTLTIRDISLPVSLPFTLAIEGDVATMAGSLTMDRTKFGVGQGAYGGGTMVATTVTVNVELTATRGG